MDATQELENVDYPVNKKKAAILFIAVNVAGSNYTKALSDLSKFALMQDKDRPEKYHGPEGQLIINKEMLFIEGIRNQLKECYDELSEIVMELDTSDKKKIIEKPKWG